MRLGRNWPRWVKDLSPHRRHMVSDLKIRQFVKKFKCRWPVEALVTDTNFGRQFLVNDIAA